jgi:hypothetical protein
VFLFLGEDLFNGDAGGGIVIAEIANDLVVGFVIPLL